MGEQLFDIEEEAQRSLDREFQACSFSEVNSELSVAGLFAGIGGIELGLARHGFHAEMLCESWEPAAVVLSEQFPGVPLRGDIRTVRSLPRVDLVSAGFPCTDLSQAGLTRGIGGKESGLVTEVFRLLRRRRPPFLLLENVRNMLVLDAGRAMRYLIDEIEGFGYRWAYRLVDSRFTGVPQRRQRVILLAALEADPRRVLLADDADEPPSAEFHDELFGFYWTEGLRGVGWARDAVPPLKGGSTVGIPSPPAIWNPHGPLGRRLLTPSVEEAGELQGFPRGWTAVAAGAARRGTRWKLVGNAVTVGVAEWVARRFRDPGDPILEGREVRAGEGWPRAAWGTSGRVWAADVSMWPERHPYKHLDGVVDVDLAAPLSARGAAGFLNRARRGSLRFAEGFLEDIEEHVAITETGGRSAVKQLRTAVA